MIPPNLPEITLTPLFYEAHYNIIVYFGLLNLLIKKLIYFKELIIELTIY